MAQNLVIDPKTKDYVITDSGSPVATDSVEMAVYFALTIPQGAWLYGTDNQGSKLFELNNAKRSASLEQQVSSSIADALDRQVISSGQASAFNTRNLEATRTGSLNRVEVIPAEIQVSGQLNFTSV